jgi:hypothetical protein
MFQEWSRSGPDSEILRPLLSRIRLPELHIVQVAVSVAAQAEYMHIGCTATYTLGSNRPRFLHDR